MVIRGGMAAGRALGYAKKAYDIYNTPQGRAAAKAAISAASAASTYVNKKRKSTFAGKHDSTQTKKVRTNERSAQTTKTGTGRTTYGRRGNTTSRKKKKSKKGTNITECKIKGFANTTEVTGAVNDPNCVYISTQSYSQVGLVEAAVAAIFRKLFQKACGWTAENYEERIPGYNGYVNNSDGWRIEMYSVNRDAGTYSPYVYTLGTTETMRTLVGDTAAGLTASAAAIMNPIKLYSSGYGDSTNPTNILEPFKMRLFALDGNTGSYWHCVADLNLRNTVIHYASSVRLRLQNRTVADSGSSATTDITVNPIGGKIYDFSSAHPKSRVDGAFALDNMSPTLGVNVQRAASFPIGAQKTAPAKGIFSNCLNVKPIHMEPGQMATTYYKHDGKLGFLNFLTKLHVGTGTNTTIRTGIGYSQLISLEDDLNYDQVQKILVVYEMTRTYGCWASTKKNKPAQVGYTQATVSNVT